MSESLKTAKYEDRPSSKLGVGEYLSQHVVWLFLPLVGFAAGLGLRKVIKAPFLNEVAGMPYASKVEKTGIAKAATEAGHYVMRRGEAWGAGLGGAYGTFRLWRANTTEQLEVDQMAKNMTALKEMESGNAFLAQENAQLRAQIKFTARHAAPIASHAAQVEASKEAASELQR